MNPAVQEMVKEIILKEGGYVNDPADSGGPTKYGVTQATYSRWLGRKASISDVKAITREVAEDIFINNYYFKPRIDIIADEVQHKTFDMSVNHGPRRAVKLLQLALAKLGFEISVDGVIGSQTARISEMAIEKYGDVRVVNKIVEVRNDFYHRIVASRPTQKRFLKGWLNRSNSFLR